MNLEICKKCLSKSLSNSLSNGRSNDSYVELHCDSEAYKEGDTEIWVFHARLCTIGEKLIGPCCGIDCGFTIDIKFIHGESILPPSGLYIYRCHLLKPDLTEEFFDLIKYFSGMATYNAMMGKQLCPYFLEHQLYDWNVKE